MKVEFCVYVQARAPHSTPCHGLNHLYESIAISVPAASRAEMVFPRAWASVGLTFQKLFSKDNTSISYCSNKLVETSKFKTTKSVTTTSKAPSYHGAQP